MVKGEVTRVTVMVKGEVRLHPLFAVLAAANGWRLDILHHTTTASSRCTEIDLNVRNGAICKQILELTQNVAATTETTSQTQLPHASRKTCRGPSRPHPSKQCFKRPYISNEIENAVLRSSGAQRRLCYPCHDS